MKEVILSFKEAVSEVQLIIDKKVEPYSFELSKGEIGVILGKKETHQIFQLILKRQGLKSGQINFGNQELSEQRKNSKDFEWRKSIGFAFRDGGLLSNLSAIENVDLPARYHGYYAHGKEEKSLAVEVLQEIGVSEKFWDRRPSDIPFKIQKKILLARSVVLNPEILLLDDPSEYFSWVDLPELFRWIKKQKKKRGILLGTEYIPFGLALADWIIDKEIYEIKCNLNEILDKSWLKQAQNLSEFLEIE